MPRRAAPRPAEHKRAMLQTPDDGQHTHELMRDARTDRQRRGAPSDGGLRAALFLPPALPTDRTPAHTEKREERRTSADAVTRYPRTGVERRRTMATPIQSVQVFGRKKAATAVAYCKHGRGLIKVNGCPIELLEPEILRLKTFEPVLLLGQTRFANVDIRIRVKGGGFTAQIYAIRQAIAKSLVAYYQKFVDEASKTEIKDILMQYDRTLLVADPRRCESKKFGGPSARARYQKSYR